MRLAISILFCFLYLKGSTQEILKIKIAKPGKPQEKCTATLLGRQGGNITKSELLFCNNIEVKGPCSYKVVSYIFSWIDKGNLITFAVSDSVISSKAKMGMLGTRIYGKFYIEKIKVTSKVTGQIFTLPSLTFKVVP